MRHQGAYRKFSRTPAHRRAMFRNLASSLIQHERFETTLPKAKDLRRVVEKLITLAATDSLANRRQALSYLQTKESVHKLFADIGPRFKGRRGGFTRVVRTRVRVGDAAEMAVIEFVERGQSSSGSKSSSATKGTKGKSAAGAKSAAAGSSSLPSVEDSGAEKASAGKSAPKKAAAKSGASTKSKAAPKSGAAASASRKKKAAE